MNGSRYFFLISQVKPRQILAHIGSPMVSLPGARRWAGSCALHLIEMHVHDDLMVFLLMHWRRYGCSRAHAFLASHLVGVEALRFLHRRAQKARVVGPAMMFASTPNFFLNLALNACMFGSGL